MKIKTVEAARSLGIHPANLLLRLADLDSSLKFEDVWPVVDSDWIETVATTGGLKRQVNQAPSEVISRNIGFPGVSTNAARVLDKLSRQGKWGGACVAFDALQNLTRIPKRDLEDAVAELRKFGLLDHDGTGRGTISLSSARRTEIHAITHHHNLS